MTVVSSGRSGRIVKYDRGRGYGFIAPDEGSEDVFVHVRDVNGSEDEVVIGTRVQFSTEEGERGLRAAHVRILDAGAALAAGDDQPVTRAINAADATTAGHGTSATHFPASAHPVVPVMPPAPPARTSSVPADDDSVEVITVNAYQREITDVLLSLAPSVTAAQIVEIREKLGRSARSRGWVE